MRYAELYSISRDEGSIVVFSGIDEDDRDVLIAVDHRMAQAIADEIDNNWPVTVNYEPWQVVG